MFNKKELKELSHICAYCGKALTEKNKTIDHITPQCANGKGYANNIVVCCGNCNVKKGNVDINNFLARNEQRLHNFHNYLKLIDIQRGNNNYSQAILKKIEKRLYVREFKTKKESRIKAIQNLEYKIYGTDIVFKVNEMQSKILNFYILNQDFSDYKALAKELNISRSELKEQILQINCLTGLFYLKEVSKNGIKLNDLFVKYLSIEKK